MAFTSKTTTTPKVEKKLPATLIITDKVKTRIGDLEALTGQSKITKGDKVFYFFAKPNTAESGNSGQVGFGTYSDKSTGERFPLNIRWFHHEGKNHLSVNEPQSKGKDEKYYADFYISDKTRKDVLDLLATGDIAE